MRKVVVCLTQKTILFSGNGFSLRLYDFLTSEFQHECR